MTDTPSAPLSNPVRERLIGLRHGLLRLHKALLDSERLGYEKIFGRINSNVEFFHLVTGHGWFAWLHPVSELVVRIDEALETKEQEVPAAHDLIAEARGLLQPSDTDPGFRRNYYDALQRDPEVVIAHAELRKILSA